MTDQCTVEEKSQLTRVVRGEQTYTHLLLKNPEETEEEKIMTERKYLKLFFKYIKKVDDNALYCIYNAYIKSLFLF